MYYFTYTVRQALLLDEARGEPMTIRRLLPDRRLGPYDLESLLPRGERLFSLCETR